MSFDANAWDSDPDGEQSREPTFERPPIGLENLIKQAGGLVQPTETLRPRTLESARHREGKRRLFGRDVPHLILAMTFLLFFVGFIGRTLQKDFPLGWIEAFPVKTGSNDQHGSHSPWVVVDAVWEWRSNQVSRLKALQPNSSVTESESDHSLLSSDLFR